MTTEQWNQFMADYGPFVWFIFLSVAAIAVLAKAWPFISSFVHTVEIIQELPTRLDRIEKRIELVEKEVTFNSGSSLKDAVRRIEERLNEAK